MSPNPSFRICRCGEPCLDDADWCGPCEKAELARKAVAARKRRDRRSKAGECADCGRKVSKAEAASDRKVKLCPAHEVKRERFRVRGVARVVAKARDRIAAATAVDVDGRTRYHGQGEKGKPTTAATNAADLDQLQKQLTTAERALQLAYAPEHTELPRIQLASLRGEARAKLGLMLRTGARAYQRLGGDVADLIANLDDD